VSGRSALQDPAALGVAGSCVIRARFRNVSRPVRLLAIVLLAAACGSPAPSDPGVTPSATVAPSALSSDPHEPRSQTETEWGVIWDELPSHFPVYPGAIPTETRAGPVTAEFAVPTDPGAAASWYRGALEAVGYRVGAFSEPLEDGSVVLDATGPPEGCLVQVKLTPLSGTTLATILFGAACPFD
jgi:hypothetical protein